MAKKRLTDTQKWLNPWFRELPPKIKLFWLWLVDNCDNAGVIKVDFALASFCIGTKVTEDEALKHIGKQIYAFNGKWYLIDFIDFQCGELSEASPAHRFVINLLKKHTLWVDYQKGIYTHIEKEREKDKEKEKDIYNIKKPRNRIPPQVELVIMYFQQRGSDKYEAEKFMDFYTSKNWYVGKNKMVDWEASVRNWLKGKIEKPKSRDIGKSPPGHDKPNTLFEDQMKKIDAEIKKSGKKPEDILDKPTLEKYKWWKGEETNE